MCDDVSNVCRLCVEALYSYHTMEDSTTRTMVEDCLQLKFAIEPPFLSAEICDDCYYKIKDFYEFKENCLSIQDLLRQDIENYEGANCIGKQGNDTVNGGVSKVVDTLESMKDVVKTTGDGLIQNEPPVVLNSTLLAPRNVSASGIRTNNETIGKVECINVSLYSGKDNVIILNKKAYHECSVCHRSYNNESTLQQHLLTHKKKRTYLCKYCPMSFQQNFNLQVHIRSHTKEKPFVCPHCGNAYGYYQLLKKHLNRYHASETESGLITKQQTSI